jgi:hypothetical protein
LKSKHNLPSCTPVFLIVEDSLQDPSVTIIYTLYL